ncbi:MAG: hypothetical protein OSA41_07595 [Erythrobacter sp.]|jgi:hypothetical protein|uniref:hypothetical protein n=1 Tax=Qipengyuania citrea TaxID=225971 RepID=UPI00209EE310|nr:hypothetical protein [Qipengyuania citrea]MDE0901566.1 hypothetical protein [Erythrobacter sp.]
MEMQDLLQRYFGTPDLAQVDPVALPAGIDRMRVDFGLERDSGRRFALWTLLYMLDAAPDLDVAFEDPAEREAARNIMDMIASASPP